MRGSFGKAKGVLNGEGRLAQAARWIRVSRDSNMDILSQDPGPEKRERTVGARHSRRYGTKPSYPLPIWNGLLEHRKKIGPAIWEFLWLIDKITIEDAGGIGWVLGKAPVKAERVAKDLDEHPNTARTNLEALESCGYITRKRTPHGHVIGVRNSKKFDAFRRQKPPKCDSQETVNHSTESHSQKTVNHVDSDSQDPGERFTENCGGDSQRTVNVSLLHNKKHNKKQNSTSKPGAATSSAQGSIDTIDLPDWVPLPPWTAFLAHRKRLGKPADLHAQILLVARLDELRKTGSDPTSVLQQSVANGWLSLVPLNSNDPNQLFRRNLQSSRLGPGNFR